ncbi:ATP-binding protein [Streptomyces sp. NPDC051561]|uniref:ATP-binding protein n=1 Tax=Streptomyces sp. NPDC051561 TaxID=3365658 RepID=UPI0037AF7528
MTSKQLTKQRTKQPAPRPGRVPSTTEESLVGTVRGRGAAGVLRARKAARAFAESLSPAPAPDTAESLVLVVSELVTNAVRHGGGRYTLALSASPETLTVCVGDRSTVRPQARTPDLSDGGGGFGWHLVELLADEVTVRPGQSVGRGRGAVQPRGRVMRGKTVRAVLAR